jgi:hypothetical protein
MSRHFVPAFGVAHSSGREEIIGAGRGAAGVRGEPNGRGARIVDSLCGSGKGCDLLTAAEVLREFLAGCEGRIKPKNSQGSLADAQTQQSVTEKLRDEKNPVRFRARIAMERGRARAPARPCDFSDGPAV